MAKKNKKNKKKLFDWRRLEFWEWLLIISIVFVAATHFVTFNDLQQLPGPIYGGDVYYHYGHVQHIADGGSAFKSSHYLEEYENYPWLSHFIIAVLFWITPGISLFKINSMVFPVLQTVFVGVLLYILGKRFLGSKPMAYSLSFLWIALNIPKPAPSPVGTFLMIPLMIFTLYYATTFRQRMIAGVVIGVCAIQHLIVFLGAFIALGLLFISKVWVAHITIKNSKLKIKKSKFWKTIKEQLVFFVPIGLVAVAVGMLYLWAPFFVYKGQTLNPWQEYAGTGSFTFSTIFQTMLSPFNQWNHWPAIVISLLAIIGIYMSFKKKSGLPWLVFFIGILGYVHPLITRPLLGTSFGYYRFPIFLLFSRFLFAALGIYFLYILAKQFLKNDWVPYAFTLIVILFSVSGLYYNMDFFRNDTWSSHGFGISETEKALFEIGDYVKEKTDVNDVFLSTHGEAGFALNALSGRKVVFMRRTHASNYADTNQRIADAAIMLYGNPEKAKQLAKQYNVKYFYEDSYSAREVQECNAFWQNLNPIYDEASYACLRVTPEYGSYLTQHGIEYTTVHARLDVADANAPRFDLLVIKPKEITNLELPVMKQAFTSDGLAAQVKEVVY
ncbi:hypothetical protein ACFL1B_02470 [Nanoarchaeota archaeon]